MKILVKKEVCESCEQCTGPTEKRQKCASPKNKKRKKERSVKRWMQSKCVPSLRGIKIPLNPQGNVSRRRPFILTA